MNRSKIVATLALAALLGGCSMFHKPTLDFSDPTVLVYTTRLGLTQTTEVVTVALNGKHITVAQAKAFRTQLDRAAAFCDLAETSIEAGKDATDSLDQALKILAAVRNDPALHQLIGNVMQPGAGNGGS
jgi:hypothetical protein